MFSSIPGIAQHTPGFRINPKTLLRFSEFVPRLYNYCVGPLGMKHELIMPARAFCSDGSQGYPTIVMAKIFGTFPFDYGMIGGLMDFGRTPAFITHGRDLVIVQATHVGYDPIKKSFGKYPRHRASVDTSTLCETSNCGHVGAILNPYKLSYRSAGKHTYVSRNSANGKCGISINDFFLENPPRYPKSIKLDISRMVGNQSEELVTTTPVSRTFHVAENFQKHLNRFAQFQNLTPGQKVSIGDALTPEWFSFVTKDPLHGFEKNIYDVMPWAVTHPEPMLAAAQACAQAEFHRILVEFYYSKNAFEGRRLIYVSGINIDVAPSQEQIRSGAFFPRTYYVPWAAMVQRIDPNTNKQISEVWNQEKLLEEFQKVPASAESSLQLDPEIRQLRTLPPVDFPTF